MDRAAHHLPDPAPLAICCFHALQALLLQIVHTVFAILFFVIWFAGVFATIFNQTGGKPPAFPTTFFLVFPLLWLGLMAM